MALLLALGAALILPACCMQQAEPRWLLRSLPGSYPEIVYFVPTDFPGIALTIDDGIDPKTTPAILEELREHGVTATFFLLSESIEGNETLLRRILDEGHEIGHHMARDEVTVDLPPDELRRRFNSAAAELERFATITWFRPGSGRYNEDILALSREHGYRIALASIPPLDTVLANPGRMASMITRMVEPGSVVVLHDRGERGRRTLETLRILLPELAGRGYTTMSLGKLDEKARQD
jgi:peptidoglycan/xylan/chitin deacetylase (PgdA/CDA1 family)